MNLYLCHLKLFFPELESNTSHSRSVHKSKKRTPLLSNLALEHLRYVNKNFQPDFHRDGNKKIKKMYLVLLIWIIYITIFIVKAHIHPQYHNTILNSKVIYPTLSLMLQKMLANSMFMKVM